MQCEMCGKEGNLVSAVVEGITMKVCNRCASFGKVIKAPQQKKHSQKIRNSETVMSIVEGFGGRVKNARESKGMKQEDLAKKAGERESIIHKIETGHYKPGIDSARKLEKILNIVLVEEIKSDECEDEKESSKKPSRSSVMTIGDMIKLRK